MLSTTTVQMLFIGESTAANKLTFWPVFRGHHLASVATWCDDRSDKAETFALPIGTMAYMTPGRPHLFEFEDLQRSGVSICIGIASVDFDDKWMKRRLRKTRPSPYRCNVKSRWVNKCENR